MLIKNCIIVNPSDVDLDDQIIAADPDLKHDLRVENGMIIEITPSSQKKKSDSKSNEAETIFDAEGLLLMPGLIDLHTHLRDFGQNGKRGYRHRHTCGSSRRLYNGCSDG